MGANSAYPKKINGCGNHAEITIKRTFQTVLACGFLRREAAAVYIQAAQDAVPDDDDKHYQQAEDNCQTAGYIEHKGDPGDCFQRWESDSDNGEHRFRNQVVARNCTRKGLRVGELDNPGIDEYKAKGNPDKKGRPAVNEKRIPYVP